MGDANRSEHNGGPKPPTCSDSRMMANPTPRTADKTLARVNQLAVYMATLDGMTSGDVDVKTNSSGRRRTSKP